MDIFISYSHLDRHEAAKITECIRRWGLTTFMAHEDIEISQEWKSTILAELGKCSAIVVVLSQNSLASTWCQQEWGIAAFRCISIVPISLDGAIPPGFISHVQGRNVKAKAPTGPREWDWTTALLARGLFSHFRSNIIEGVCKMIGGQASFASSEFNFSILEPLWDTLSEDEANRVAQAAIDQPNNQVLYAGHCIKELLPNFLKRTAGKLSSERVLKITEAIGS